MEILGYIIIDSAKLKQVSTKEIKLDEYKLFVKGKRTSREDAEEYLFGISAKCIVQSVLPAVEDETNVEQDTKYDKYVNISRAIKVECNKNLDILHHDSFELVAYEDDSLVTIPADTFVGTSIINYLETDDVKYADLKTVIDSAIKEIKDVTLPPIDWANIFKRQGKPYADIYLEPSFSVITDGTIKTKQESNATGGTDTIYYWEGKYPLDRLIYTIQSTLDILIKNKRINGDIYGNLFATLFAQAMQSATVIEQTRIQAYEQSSQFEIKSQLEYYLGVITAKLNILKSLAEVQVQFLNKSLVASQIKLYAIQTEGFKANNIYKLFSAQLDGASTAYSAGMLETAPVVYNNPDQASLYTQVMNAMPKV